MTSLRFSMLLCLTVWIGSIIFFGAVVAPTVFIVLPTHELAGRVVSRSLAALHWIGFISGGLFILASITHSKLSCGTVRLFAARNVLTFTMIVLTAISQFGISSRMNLLRAQMGVIDQVAATDALRLEFNRLHQWSTRVEMMVLALGLVLIYLNASQGSLANSPREGDDSRSGADLHRRLAERSD